MSSSSSSSSSISFSGVGSGNDWSTIISELVAAEKAPETAITQKKTDANTQLSLVGDLLSRMTALGTASNAFTTASTLYGSTATSSDSTRITATSAGTPSPGSYAVTVNKLAQGETREGTGLTSGNAGAAGTGTISIGVGTGTAVPVNYSTTDSLSDIAARINSTVPGVTASAIYDGTSYHMVLTSTATGKSNGLNITESGSGLGLADPSSIVQAAGDASLTVNGVNATESSNTVTDVIPGVTLNLQSQTPTGGATTLITVGRDPSTVTAKVQSLISAYNSVASLVGGQLAYTGTTRGQDTLFGDPIISGLQRQLGGVMAQSFTHGSTQISAATLGITIGADGTLSMDSSKFAAALATDPTSITDLLTGANGLGAKISALTTAYTSSTGPLLTREASLQTQMKSYDSQIQEWEDRGTALNDRLKKQFASLDALMATYTTNSTYLSKL